MTLHWRRKMTPTENDVGNPDLPRNELTALHRFNGVMIEKLVKNKHKGGWQRDDMFALEERMDQEGGELYKEILELDRLRRAGADSAKLKEQAKRVAREAADVANFAMMIADVSGGLEP